MDRPNWKYVLVIALAAVVVFSAVPRADAQWWGAYPRGWGYGYASCCYAPCAPTWSCYSPCSYSYGCYLGWRPGPVRRLLFGSYRWYCGGCWTDCCSTAWACDPCCTEGSTSTPTVAPGQTPTPAKKPMIEPTMPMEPGVPAAPAPAEPAPLKTSDATAEESGVLTVWVPYDAKVTVNGLETRSTGSRRQFISYGLKPGFEYKYEVRAQVVRNGQIEEDVRTVTLTAGQITAVAFGFNVGTEQLASAQ